MDSIYYSAAWTDSHFFFTCDDHHSTIGEAVACIPCAGGYVVAVEMDKMRELTPDEENEFQSIAHAVIPYAPRLIKPVSDSTSVRAVDETLLELVLRVLCAYGFDAGKESEIKLGSVHSGGLRGEGSERQPKAA